MALVGSCFYYRISVITLSVELFFIEIIYNYYFFHVFNILIMIRFIIIITTIMIVIIVIFIIYYAVPMTHNLLNMTFNAQY